jgi:glutamyl-tRNA reductase
MKENNRLMGILQMAGINHRSAPLHLREKLAVPPENMARMLALLSKKSGVNEIVVLSTCNRTELYWSSQTFNDPHEFFTHVASLDEEIWEQIFPAIYEYGGQDVARHLFEVAAGLDSMVLGETQIYNQVKNAYEQSRVKGFTGIELNFLFQKAFETTKKVHADTGLVLQKASIPSVAMEFVKETIGNPSKAFVLVIGTGEIAKLTAEVLQQRGVRQITFITKNEERARQWQPSCQNAEVATLDKIGKLLWKADILVACTATKKPLITALEIKRALGFRNDPERPMLILDLGLPRNVDPAVAQIGGVYLRDIDDLQRVVEKNKAKLDAEVVKAKKIINQGVAEYIRFCRSAIAAPTIKEIREQAKQLVDKELERAMRKLAHLSPKDRNEVSKLARSIQGKILHSPSEQLRRLSGYGNPQMVILLARILFGLEPSSPGGPTSKDS